MAKTSIRKKQAGIPKGGTTGQVLIKNSGTDFDYDWGDASGPTVPGDITAHAVPVSTLQSGGLPPIILHYLKCGKYYSNIWFANNPDTGVYNVFADNSGTRAQLQVLLTAVLGVTVDTWYTATNYGNENVEYPAGSWVGHSPTNVVVNALTSFIST